MSAEMTTGGAAIADALLANGIDTVFGLPGAQLYPFFDALQQRADRIRTIGARHEQACGYMAFGHARSTGRPGVFSVVPGPGVLNTAAALCTAMGCCAPVLCITGQVPTAFLGKGRGHLHELSDQLGTLGKIVKWTARIERPSDAFGPARPRGCRDGLGCHGVVGAGDGAARGEYTACTAA
jgi:acetolactate synthase I/II/III large subunit